MSVHQKILDKGKSKGIYSENTQNTVYSKSSVNSISKPKDSEPVLIDDSCLSFNCPYKMICPTSDSFPNDARMKEKLNFPLGIIIRPYSEGKGDIY